MRLLALAGLTVAMAASTAGAATPIPSIHLAGVTLSGAHFLPLKTVKVTIVSTSKTTLSAKPAKNGTFKLKLASDVLAGCGGDVKISATGPRGEAASLNIPEALCPGGSTVGVTANADDGSTVSASG